jgi:hypothetical protein
VTDNGKALTRITRIDANGECDLVSAQRLRTAMAKKVLNPYSQKKAPKIASKPQKPPPIFRTCLYLRNLLRRHRTFHRTFHTGLSAGLSTGLSNTGLSKPRLGIVIVTLPITDKKQYANDCATSSTDRQTPAERRNCIMPDIVNKNRPHPMALRCNDSEVGTKGKHDAPDQGEPKNGRNASLHVIVKCNTRRCQRLELSHAGTAT